MADPQLGQKRTCVECGVRFYTLQKMPPVCPVCGAEQPASDSPLKKRDEDILLEKSKSLKAAVPEDDLDIDTADDDVTADDDLDDDDDISQDIEVGTTKDKSVDE